MIGELSRIVGWQAIALWSCQRHLKPSSALLSTNWVTAYRILCNQVSDLAWVVGLVYFCPGKGVVLSYQFPVLDLQKDEVFAGFLALMR